MDIYDIRTIPERTVSEFGSSGAQWSAITRSEGECHVGRMRIEPGGVVGMHTTRTDQLFLVIDGSGWTRVADEPRRNLMVGDAVLWRTGEHHESGTDTGMTAIIVQAERLAMTQRWTDDTLT
jgi:quercetin dioxygenase-like cupin family protein